MTVQTGTLLVEAGVRYNGIAQQLSETEQELVVDSPQTEQAAADLLNDVGRVLKRIKGEEDKIKKPINEARNEVLSLFKKLRAPFEQMRDSLKEKVKDYGDRVRAEAEERRQTAEAEAQAAAQAAAEKAEAEGKDLAGIALAAAEAHEETAQQIEEETKGPASQVRGMTGGSVRRRKKKVVRIVEADKVPRGYWVLDEVKIRKDALAGVEIPGVVVEEEDVIATYTG